MKPISSVILCIALFCTATTVLAATDPWADAHQSLVSMDWSTAASQYAALRATAEPGSKQWVEATFCEAVASQQTQPASASTINSAAKLFQEVVDQGHDDRFIARSIMNLGRIAELVDYPDDAVDLDGARKKYEEVMQRWPNEPIGSEAALRAGASLVTAYDAPDFVKVKAGIALIETWLGEHPNNPYANVMWQYAGDSYFRPLGDFSNAIRCYNKVDAIGWPDKGNEGNWYWRCAELADNYLNDPKTAIHYYTQLINKTPSHPQAYAAYQALKKLHAPLPDAPFLEDSAPTTAPSVAPGAAK